MAVIGHKQLPWPERHSGESGRRPQRFVSLFLFSLLSNIRKVLLDRRCVSEDEA